MLKGLERGGEDVSCNGCHLLIAIIGVKGFLQLIQIGRTRLEVAIDYIG